MKIIYKYELGINGEVRVINDNVSKFLHVESQNGVPMLWAEINLNSETDVSWNIISIGTGWELPDEFFDYQYLGTALDKYGYVWHYYAERVIKEQPVNKNSK